MEKILLSDCAKIAYISPDQISSWFGYYNYCPENSDGTKLLAHQVDFDGRSINKDDVARIGWYDISTGAWHLVAETKAFNWQQGSMLQWLSNEDKFIYNDVENNEFISRSFDINTGKFQKYSWPIYGIKKDGSLSISLQFKRSYWCRAYHYESICDDSWNGLLPANDGIYTVDLINDRSKLIISTESLTKIDPDETFSRAKHWVEHIMLNPSGTRFAFYHRFSYENGFVTRVFTANIDGSDLRLIEGWRDYSWSHMGWSNDDEFYIYGVRKISVVQAYRKLTEQHGRFGRLIRILYKKTLSKLITKQVRKKTSIPGNYIICNCVSGRISGEIPSGLFPLDGHPSFSRDGRFMLTDTYEDDNSYRHLYIYDVNRQKKIEVARFYSPFNSCDYRSDLHPRFNKREDRIVVDSAHSGYHRIVGIDIDWDIIQRMLDDQ